MRASAPCKRCIPDTVGRTDYVFTARQRENLPATGREARDTRSGRCHAIHFCVADCGRSTSKYLNYRWDIPRNCPSAKLIGVRSKVRALRWPGRWGAHEEDCQFGQCACGFLGIMGMKGLTATAAMAKQPTCLSRCLKTSKKVILAASETS